MITASAPGKVVLTGEYAVLAGAPALVMAVERRARVRVEAGGEAGWRFEARGFSSSPSAHPPARFLDRPPPRNDPAFLFWHALSALVHRGARAAALPPDMDVVLDSRALHADDRKLGLGSSAAVVAALTAAIDTLTSAGADVLSSALEAHHDAQGGLGSGLDVAAACAGGLIRFRRTDGDVEVRGAVLPRGLGFRFVWSGRAADTGDHVRRFEHWRAGGTPPALTALADSAAAMAGESADAGEFVRQLRRYVERLGELDRQADIGIYSDAHRALAGFAAAAGVVYKPCGAGGGDLGVAVSDDPAGLDAFARALDASPYAPMELELAAHGIEITRD